MSTSPSGAYVPDDGRLARDLDVGRWSLNGLAAAVSEWHARELPGKASMTRVAKVAEEVGEMIGAHIKAAEPDRQDGRDRQDEAEDEWADVVISAMGAAEALGITDPDERLARRWAVVRQRRFATRATPGVGESRGSCVAPNCTYHPEAGSSYCVLHGTRWGRERGESRG